MMKNSLFMEYTSYKIISQFYIIAGYMAYLISKDISQFFIMLGIGVGFFMLSLWYWTKYRRLKFNELIFKKKMKGDIDGRQEDSGKLQQ